MMSFPILSGLIASAIHVISGPDHLAAVTPFVVESKKKAWKVGLSWGLGHVSGMMLIGMLFYFFKELIPFEKISGYSEQLVGIILIGLGLWVMIRMFYKKKHHNHTHYHDIEAEPYIHTHEHIHSHSAAHNHFHKEKDKGFTFGIGLIHGLAGISHLILLIPVLGFETRMASALYILGFGFGSIIAMVSYTIIINFIAKSMNSNHRPGIASAIQIVAGMFALIIGFFWIYQTF